MLTPSAHRHLPVATDERGAVLVITVAVLLTLLFAAAYAVDEGIWFVHHAHLQTEADAAALAAAQNFQYPCSEAVEQGIKTRVEQYGGVKGYEGKLYNEQVPVPPLPSTVYSSTLHNLIPQINQPNFVNQVQPADTGLSASPCADSAIDVKLSETNLPSFFPPLLSPKYITAQARVSIENLTSVKSGLSPLAEPLPTPEKMKAYLIDEGNGNANLATVELSHDNTKTKWTGTVPSFSFNATGPIGMQVEESGGSAEETFDATDKIGVTYTRVWSHPANTTPGQPAAGTPAAPQVDEASFDPTGSTCPNNGTFSNFISTSKPCAVTLKVTNVRFAEGTGAPAVNCADAGLTVKAGSGSAQAIACPSATPLNGQTWTTEAITVTPNAGPTNITLGWSLQAGNKPSGAEGGTSGKCGDGKGSDPKPCTGSFGVVQRIFSGAYDSQSSTSSHSGGVLAASLTAGGSDVQSIPKSSPATTVTISVEVLSFQNSQSIPSPPVELSFGGNQENGLVSCPGQSAGKPAAEKAITEGCQPPNNEFQLDEDFATSPPCQTVTTPPDCLGEVPGNGKLDKVLDGAMNTRINGSKNAGCKAFNYWASPNKIPQLLNESPPDPRLLTLFTTDYGVLGNGRHKVPIRAIADFYVTGWQGDPCIGHANGVSTVGQTTGGTVTLNYTGDDAPRAEDNGGDPAGVLLGHFVQYTELSSGGSGSGQCAQSTSLGNCIAILTK